MAELRRLGAYPATEADGVLRWFLDSNNPFKRWRFNRLLAEGRGIHRRADEPLLAFEATVGREVFR